MLSVVTALTGRSPRRRGGDRLMTLLSLLTGTTCLALATTATGLVWAAVRLAYTPRTKEN